jgi:hypothetical protein
MTETSRKRGPKKPQPLPHKREIDEIFIYRETRGVREFSLSKFRRDDDFMTRARTLGTCADRLLAKVREKTYKQALEQAKGDIDTPKVLLSWVAEIGARRGVLSQVSIAARYLAAQHMAGLALMSDGPLDEKLKLIFAFSNAWHWWHSEIYGEHRAIFESERARENLAKRNPAAIAKRQQRKSIVQKICVAQWLKRPRHKTNALQTATAILDDANARLKSEGHREYKLAPLARVVREIINSTDI